MCRKLARGAQKFSAFELKHTGVTFTKILAVATMLKDLSNAPLAMAFIFPNTPLGTVTPEVLKLFRLLKRLPDETYVVWHRLAVASASSPDFWILSKDQRALFISVSSATPADIRTIAQPSLLNSLNRPSSHKHPLDESIISSLTHFAEQAGIQIPTLVVFPNLSSLELKGAPLARFPTWVMVAGKEILHPETFEAWVQDHLSEPLTTGTVTQIRKAFTPEVIIPPQFTVRAPITRNTDAQLTNYLLDYNQEWVLKTDLALTQEGEATAREFGLHLVNGVAGSGKSLILLYRAHLLRELYPDKRILVLTHNKPLSHDLRSRYQRLRAKSRTSEKTEWKTFHGWCHALWPKSQPAYQTIGMSFRNDLIRSAWQAQLQNTVLSESILQEEIDWYKDRMLFSRADYLSADRAGRGFALNEVLRNKVYDALEAYDHELAARHLSDWGDVPRRIWQLIQTGKMTLPIYDIVLVDEAQFFAPIWFEIIKRTLKPRVGHLFLAADPTQGFLKRRQSWLASGLDVRGHSSRLQKSYRTTREILSFAALLYRSSLPEDDDDIVVPDLLDMPNGVLPEVIPLTSEQDEITRVTREIHALVQASVPLDHILVIHANYQGRNHLQERLEKLLGPHTAVDPKNLTQGPHIRVCTLNAATGLESPIVFLVGMHELYGIEQSIRISDQERLELVRDNTRKIYMAITHAGQRLVMTYVGALPETLRQVYGTIQA